MSLRDRSATEVMNENPETVQNDANLAKAKNKMEEHDLRALTVVDSKNRVEGAIGYRDLIRHVQFNPDNASLEKVMHNPPKFEDSDSLVDIAELRIESGRKMLVKTKNGKLQGIVGDDEFREAFVNAEEFSQVTTLDLGANEVLQAFEEDSIEEVRHKMLDNNISRLPVLDNSGNLTGIVTSTDLLKVMISRERQGSGGTSRDNLQDLNISGGSEKESMAQIEISEIMDRTPLTIEGHQDADEAIQKMSENDEKEVIIVEDRYPQSIVTVKDYIEEVSNLQQRNAVLVNLTGLDVDEEKAAVHNKIETQLRGSLGRKLKRPEELNLVMKKAEKDGKKHRYEATMKLFSEFGQTTVQSEAWDLLEVVDDCLSEMNRLIRDKKEQRTEH
ncbi:CBS domain-containing protein [Candidatus Nanohalobium constans]|uniref:CBS domain containing membrane protein n=1 Tax=Candidatus Nanohalobium constans TaxID=2565781 RepID=A0A5Q0UFT2_9ARCH|nr:CBS domain-containing protein [Candidatus Nanohalobium constans]QGA80404.1 CBS domain containing membrane protein [Candidatus Nanohalobium constans]